MSFQNYKTIELSPTDSLPAADVSGSEMFHEIQGNDDVFVCAQ
jgi:hypothetical protein